MNTFDHINRQHLQVITNYDYSYENLPDTSIYQRFRIKYRPVGRALGSWRDEVIETAGRIHAAAEGRPLLLGLSGGIDSEVMARGFLEANIPFQGLSLRYTDDLGGLNDHDIKHAEEFCREHEIPHEIINLDFKRFFLDRGEEYIQQGYRAVNMFRFTQLMVLETAEARGSAAVMAGGEQLYYSRDGVTYIQSSPDFSVPVQWCYDHRTRHFPYFFRQNSEIFAAYQQEPLIKLMLANPFYHENPVPNASLEKMIVYHGYFPDMPRRRKYHGFERILDFRRQQQDSLKERFPDLDEKIYLSVPRIQAELGISTATVE